SSGGRRKRRNRSSRKGLMGRLPFPLYCPKSKVVISAVAPLAIGALVSILVAVMGVGGGFLMVPAMIYLLGMPTQVVIGTSLMQIIFVTAAATIFHAASTQTVDALLALLLLVGAVVGTRIGIQIGRKLKAEQLRVLLALIVLGVGIRLAVELVQPPERLYVVEQIS
ncbi:MAG: sulfite exporter TauE/SafE family protein, partial [Sphingomonadales bacterium]